MSNIIEELHTDPFGTPKPEDDNTDPNAGLLEMVAAWRAELADPNSIYAGRPEVIERAKVEIEAILLRAGVEEPKIDPLQLAREQHARSFSMAEKPIDDDTAVQLESRCEALEEQHSKQELEQMASALREEVGAEEYDKLIEDATSYIDAAKLPLGARADLLTLKAVASAGRYMRAYYRTMPGREQD